VGSADRRRIFRDRKLDQSPWELAREKIAIRRVLSGEIALPSILSHYRQTAKIQVTQA
jgi:hypothetical protein